MGKFALRALSQSLAREFGPQGVHVAHAIIDGMIDTERTKDIAAEAEDGKISSDAVSAPTPKVVATVFERILREHSHAN